MNSLSGLAVSNDNFAFDPFTGHSYKINKTAKEVINLFTKGCSEDEVIKHLSKKYDIPEEQIYIDIMDFCSKLEIFHLVTK